MNGAAELHNVIDGHAVPAREGRTTAVVDPSTGAEYARAPLSDATDVDAAYAAASRASESWRFSTPAERQRALLRLADAIEARAEPLRRSADGLDRGRIDAVVGDLAHLGREHHDA